MLAARTVVPMSFKFPAAAAISSCAANTYDIGEPPTGPRFASLGHAVPRAGNGLQPQKLQPKSL
ncbi:hypothetical protein MMEU_1887 [Mycobacterium marinum str. Europe]|nr:hypothetical protein MMEU_1887 [Mycobacterium marinum str. Europe]